jgi:hypothetical protein
MVLTLNLCGQRAIVSSRRTGRKKPDLIEDAAAALPCSIVLGLVRQVLDIGIMETHDAETTDQLAQVVDAAVGKPVPEVRCLIWSSAFISPPMRSASWFATYLSATSGASSEYQYQGIPLTGAISARFAVAKLRKGQLS